MQTQTELEIRKNWIYSEPPLVSVVCVTYNQESYIEDAIRGFLIQETDFPFEIIIHDDASTDGTTAIVKEYAERYPNLIRPVLQQENQFSQPGKNVILIAVSYTRGQYIALCEGDDYWMDSKKLHKQMATMQQYPECRLSFHPALKVDMQNHKKTIMDRHAKHNKVFNVGDIIKKSGGYCPTASLIFKKEVFNSIPNWFYQVTIGDYFLQILGALKGGALYIDEVMSVYRVNAQESWSVRKINPIFLMNQYIRILDSLDSADRFMNYICRRQFNIAKRITLWRMSQNTNFSAEKRRETFRLIKNKLGVKEKILWLLVYQYPCFSRMLGRVRGKTKVLQCFLFNYKVAK